MEYTMVTEYSHGDLTVWILTRDEDKHLELAIPMPNVGNALAVIAAGELGLMTSTVEDFYEAVALSDGHWGDDMDPDGEHGGEGHFPHLNWLPLKEG